MAKWQADIILDTALDYIKNNVTQMAVCSAQPANYAEATSTYKLALKTGLTSGSFTGAADGTPDGRKLTVNEQAAIAVATGGDATHVALCSGTVLLYVTTCTQQTLTSGNTVTVPLWTVTLRDAS